MRVEWDESYFEAKQQDASVYWVCFWTGDDVDQPTRHDPQRVTEAESVEEVLAWISAEKGERRFELFVETADHAESRESGWVSYRKLIRLAGDFHPGGTTVSVVLTRSN
ncbi:hypothetical protein [Microbacterium sp. P05]|uniref:hypothetical protein n=1 Tax=Microbacterium sp. P05 TaxID=3366948 RepID=UPI00374593CF